MVSFNLLPWRQNIKTYRRKKLIHIILFTIVLTMILNLLTHFILQQQIANQRIYISNLRQKERMLTQKKMKHHEDELLTQVRTYQHLTNTLFSQFRIPEGICLDSIKRVNHTVTFSGFAYSYEDLFNFLKSWRVSARFDDVQMPQIKRKEAHLIAFNMNVKHKSMTKFVSDDADTDDAL